MFPEPWRVLKDVDPNTFDWGWQPNLNDPPYIYIWGNNWVSGEEMPTIIYSTPGATEVKYMYHGVPKLANNPRCWVQHDNIVESSFDWSWSPHPWDPPYIYAWGNKWIPAEEKPTLEYRVPGATQYKYMPELVDVVPQMDRWKIKVGGIVFDYSWRPPAWDEPYIYVWGNKWVPPEEEAVLEYHVPGATQYKYMPERLHVNLEMFWINTGNNNHDEYIRLKNIYPEIKNTRYTNSWIETIQRCAKKSSTKFCWILSSELDYTNFNFEYYPLRGQDSMVHIFGNQWSKWSNTYFICAYDFNLVSKNCQAIQEIDNLCFPEHSRAEITKCNYSILHINFGNQHTALLDKNVEIFTTEWRGSYLSTLKFWLQENLKTINFSHLWVTSSICDYTNFNFTWLPNHYEVEQLHVFSSYYGGNKQEYGDTFLLNIKMFRKEYNSLDALENYPYGINYIDCKNIIRLPHPIIEHNYGSHKDALHLMEDNFPYTELLASRGIHKTVEIQPPKIWDENKFELTAYGSGNQQIVVPRNIADNVKNELWDYPRIKSSSMPLTSAELDIIFISNGELYSESNYEYLESVLAESGVGNRLVWIKNISGRVASQHAAATASNTDWYFLVNGKIKIEKTFDWGWQPDRLQVEKHYIFKVLNPVNGLFYGHQAIVANNKNLTLNTAVTGLDFTMDSPHTVVDINCGVALYNSDPWTAWRTGFREAIKLRCNVDIESKQRLESWLSPGCGAYAEWSQRGAIDGVEYWQTVDGRMVDLMLSYDWGWIHKYYTSKYGE